MDESNLAEDNQRHVLRRAGRLLFSTALGGLLVVMAFWLIHGFSSSTSSDTDAASNAPGNAEGPSGLVAPGEPCHGAVHAQDPSHLSTKTPVWLPSDRYELTDAWTCTDTPVLLYGDVQLSFEEGWSDIDVKQKWADMARDYGGTVTTALDRPALVLPATDSTHSEVLVVNDGVLIRALGVGNTDADELEKLVSTIQVEPSQSGG